MLNLSVLVQKLRNTLGKMEIALGAIAEGIVWTNSKGCVEWSNASFEKMVDLERLTGILGQPLHEILPLKQNGQEVSKENHPAVLVLEGKEYRLPFFDFYQGDNHIVLEISGKSFDSSQDEKTAVFVLRDVTKRKEAERRMEGIARFPSESPSPILRVNKEGKILYLNTPAYPILESWGCKPDASVEGEWLEEIKEVYTSGEMKEKELKHNDKHYSLLIVPIKGVDYVNIYGYDITKLKVLELQLLNAQKLESIGQLAAGIAHEINTPIQYVGDNIQFFEDAFNDIESILKEHKELIGRIKEKQDPGELVESIEKLEKDVDLEFLIEELPKALEQSKEGVRRTSKIVKSMKDFSHPGSENQVLSDVNKALEVTTSVSRNEWKYVATLETDFAEDLPLIPLFPDEFNQTILNLIVNASHAIGDKVGDGSTGQGVIKVSTALKGDFVEVRVQDSGMGIPESAQAKIFDPFFTTKEVGKGTGQGLAISHSVIVEQHHGRISFETKAGEGTTFIIELPVEEVKAAKKES